MNYAWFILAVIFLLVFISIAGALGHIADAYKRWMTDMDAEAQKVTGPTGPAGGDFGPTGVGSSATGPH